MEKEIKELMKPRYMVIADYPHSPYKIGDLVEISDSSTSFHCTTTKVYDAFTEDIVNSENYFSVLQIENYSHLFRKLSWWENRKVEEMPEYLLSSETFPNPHYVKVKNHYASFFEGEYNGKDTFKPYWEAGYTLYFPSTEQECKNHINNQNLK